MTSPRTSQSGPNPGSSPIGSGPRDAGRPLTMYASTSTSCPIAPCDPTGVVAHKTPHWVPQSCPEVFSALVPKPMGTPGDSLSALILGQLHVILHPGKQAERVQEAGPDTPQTPVGVSSWPYLGLPHHRLSTTLLRPDPKI